MKKLLTLAMCGALSLSIPAFAQTTPQTQTSQPQEPRALSDKTMSTRLQKDLTTRNSSLGTTPVTWYDAGYGYYGTYTQNNQSYMIRYDRTGNYVETMQRREWNDQIPQATRDAFSQSTYGSQRVTGYWETTDPGRKGSYYELTGSDGQRSRVWANDKGVFTTQPGTSGTKPQNP